MDMRLYLTWFVTETANYHPLFPLGFQNIPSNSLFSTVYFMYSKFEESLISMSESVRAIQ